MPIDYSRFDNIDVSDDEDEQAYKARKEAEEAGRRASKAQAKECVEAWWQACPRQSQFSVECAARLTRAGTTSRARRALATSSRARWMAPSAATARPSAPGRPASFAAACLRWDRSASARATACLCFWRWPRAALTDARWRIWSSTGSRKAASSRAPGAP